MPEAITWREKYLNSLDDQEALEKKLSDVTGLLRTLAVSLGAAATGLDDGLDKSIAGLKEALRNSDEGSVRSHVKSVEMAVRNLVGRRDGDFEHVTGKIAELIAGLRTLAVDDSLLKSLKEMERKLSGSQFSILDLPELLQTVVELQKTAFEQAKLPPSGLWERLRGGTHLKKEVIDQPFSEVTASLNFDEQDLSVPTWDNAREPIKNAVGHLLGEFTEQEQQLASWQRAKSRSEELQDWQHLIDILGDVKSVLNGRDDVSNEAISDYLAQLNDDLHQISERLGVGVQTQQARDEAAQLLGQTIASRVARIHSAVDQSTDLASLKGDIREQVQIIQKGLDAFKEQQKAQAHADELQQLAEKVRQMENEAALTQQLLAEQSYRAHHDALTELPNRESYNQRVEQELQRYGRYGRDLTLAVVDIDHFKSINDTFGHQTGDRVLKVFAKFLRQRLRNVDFVARYGGEEFVILLPETDLKSASDLMDRTRQVISETPFRFKSTPVNISFSCGVSGFSKGDSAADVFERADRALYRAKENGRNQVCTDDQ